MRIRNAFVVVAAAAAMLLLATGAGAQDMFLKIEGIQGDAAPPRGTPGQIAVAAFKTGVSAASAATASGRARSRASFEDLSITKWVDAASPQLMLKCAEGRHIPKAMLTLFRTVESGQSLPYMTILMENVFVTSVAASGQGGGSRPTEEVTLNFERVTMEYIPYDRTGKAMGKVASRWNVAENKAW